MQEGKCFNSYPFQNKFVQRPGYRSWPELKTVSSLQRCGRFIRLSDKNTDMEITEVDLKKNKSKLKYLSYISDSFSQLLTSRQMSS